MKYLVCIDGSVHCQKAMRELSKILRNGDVVELVNVWWVTDTLEEFGGLEDGIAPIMLTCVQTELMKDATEKRAHASKRMLEVSEEYLKSKCPGVQLEFKKLSEQAFDARELICSLAEKDNINVIVMGTRGLGLVKRMLLGSVSTHISNNAPCSVWIVR